MSTKVDNQELIQEMNQAWSRICTMYNNRLLTNPHLKKFNQAAMVRLDEELKDMKMVKPSEIVAVYR